MSCACLAGGGCSASCLMPWTPPALKWFSDSHPLVTIRWDWKFGFPPQPYWYLLAKSIALLCKLPARHWVEVGVRLPIGPHWHQLGGSQIPNGTMSHCLRDSESGGMFSSQLDPPNSVMGGVPSLSAWAGTVSRCCSGRGWFLADSPSRETVFSLAFVSTKAGIFKKGFCSAKLPFSLWLQAAGSSWGLLVHASASSEACTSAGWMQGREKAQGPRATCA